MMRRGRIITAAASAVAAVAFAAPAALAATPQQIGRDLADGRLDGTYSKQELSDYLRNAAEQGYGGPISQSAPRSGILGGEAGESDSRLAAGGRQGGGTLAFTGFDLALLTVGGLFLLALGAVLRWASRERAWRKREW
jgi:hypothetical protein